jgi:hypothetical protein
MGMINIALVLIVTGCGTSHQIYSRQSNHLTSEFLIDDDHIVDEYFHSLIQTASNAESSKADIDRAMADFRRQFLQAAGEPPDIRSYRISLAVYKNFRLIESRHEPFVADLLFGFLDDSVNHPVFGVDQIPPGASLWLMRVSGRSRLSRGPLAARFFRAYPDLSFQAFATTSHSRIYVSSSRRIEILLAYNTLQRSAVLFDNGQKTQDEREFINSLQMLSQSEEWWCRCYAGMYVLKYQQFIDNAEAILLDFRRHEDREMVFVVFGPNVETLPELGRD